MILKDQVFVLCAGYMAAQMYSPVRRQYLKMQYNDIGASGDFGEIEKLLGQFGLPENEKEELWDEAENRFISVCRNPFARAGLLQMAQRLVLCREMDANAILRCFQPQKFRIGS
ncbi:MAG: hypothetical protein EP347_10030 [Alphaproteobacteria bacterium]|nr:MAG: hypothetical protein EP347_10030 [Alphaproteobacteria bacterium]